ncbi:MAG: hypothetical protein ACRDNO_25260 [Trebonia sp.]
MTTVIQSPLPNWRVAVYVHIGEDPEELLHRRRVRFLSADRFGEPGNVRDHVAVVDGVHCGEVAGVKRVVALLHQREQPGGPAGGVGGGCHEGSFSCRPAAARSGLSPLPCAIP